MVRPATSVTRRGVLRSTLGMTLGLAGLNLWPAPLGATSAPAGESLAYLAVEQVEPSKTLEPAPGLAVLLVSGDGGETWEPRAAPLPDAPATPLPVSAAALLSDGDIALIVDLDAVFDDRALVRAGRWCGARPARLHYSS